MHVITWTFFLTVVVSLPKLSFNDCAKPVISLLVLKTIKLNGKNKWRPISTSSYSIFIFSLQMNQHVQKCWCTSPKQVQLQRPKNSNINSKQQNKNVWNQAICLRIIYKKIGVDFSMHLDRSRKQVFCKNASEHCWCYEAMKIMNTERVFFWCKHQQT